MGDATPLTGTQGDETISGTVLHPGAPVDGPRCYAHDDDPALRSHGHFMGPAGVPAHTWGAGPSGEPGCRRCGGHLNDGDRYLCQPDGIVHVTCPVPALGPPTAPPTDEQTLTDAERQALHEAFDDNPDASGDWVITRKEWRQLFAAVERILADRARPVPAATHTDPAAQACPVCGGHDTVPADHEDHPGWRGCFECEAIWDPARVAGRSAAQALRDAADVLSLWDQAGPGGGGQPSIVGNIVAWLRDRADGHDAGAGIWERAAQAPAVSPGTQT